MAGEDQPGGLNIEFESQTDSLSIEFKLVREDQIFKLTLLGARRWTSDCLGDVFGRRAFGSAGGIRTICPGGRRL